jgi:hypothetical protein
LLFNNAGTTAYGGIVTLSGTTTTISTATCFSSSSFSDAIVISSSKVLVTANATTSNLNILTDSSGTASAGTAVTGGSSASNFTLFVNGNNVVFQNGTGSNSFSVWMVDVSGSSPGTPKRIFSGTTTSSAIGITTSYANLVRVPTAFYSTNFAQTNGSYYAATFFRFRITDASVTALNVGDGLPALSQFLGKNDLQRWSVNNVNYLYKVECAA